VQSRRDRLHRIEWGWGWARLFTFFAAIVVWYPLAERTAPAAAATLVFLVLFSLSVRRHAKARKRRELADRVLLMLDEAQQRCGAEIVLIRDRCRPEDPDDDRLALSPILDDGPKCRLTEQERDDLDFYSAPVGLFGLVNRCSSGFGARRLRDLIENPLLSIAHLRRRQQAVVWLEQNPGRRFHMMGAAAVLRDRDTLLENLLVAIRQAEPLPWGSRKVVLRIWSLVSAVLTIIALLQTGLGRYGWAALILALLLLNSLLYLRMRQTLNRCLRPWKNVQTAAKGLWHVSQESAESLPGQEGLGLLRDCFAPAVEKHVLPALCRRVGWVDAGGMMHALFNAMFFYDLHVAASVLGCVVPNRERLTATFAALADLEALLSLACFASESLTVSGVSYPKFVDDKVIEIVGGKHPLIDVARVVPNDIHLTPKTRLWVVTGSNMAGKSTLLRMCGVNCLLAQIGTVVMAEAMTLCSVRLISDLQVRDNLADDESYFLAEVRHLRRMIVPESDGGHILGLMDEPFRGTNSAEQVAAALAVVEHLLKTPNFFLLATHEQQLTGLADKLDGAENRHFQENLSAEGLVYDYRLRPGPAVTRNALRVLQREGYPRALLDRAQEWLGTDGPAPAGEA
jgi:hypothetical protein